MNHFLLSQKQSVFWIACSVVLLFNLPSFVQDSFLHASQYENISELGHGTIESASWNPNGRLIAVSGSRGIWIYDENYQNAAHLDVQHTGEVMWSPNGSQLAVAGGLTEQDNASIVYIWDNDFETQLHELTLSNYSSEITAVAWHPNSSQIAISGNRTVWIWNTLTGSLLRTLEVEGWVSAIAWSPDGSFLIGATNQEVLIWHSDTWNGATVFSVSDVQDVAWNADGSQFALVRGSQLEHDNSLQIWALDEIAPRLVIQAGFAQTVDWGFDGQGIATGSHDGIVRLWNPFTGTLAARLHGHTRPVNVVEWLPGENQLLSAAEDNTLRLWNLALDQPSNAVQKNRILAVHSGEITALTWSPDSNLVATGSEDGNLRMWDVQDETSRIIGFHTEMIDLLAWSSDGDVLVSGTSATSLLKIWDVNAARQLFEIDANALQLQSFSADRFSLVGLSWSADSSSLEFSISTGAVFRWNRYNNQVDLVASSHDVDSISAAVWSPDHHRIAQLVTGSEQILRLLNTDIETEYRLIACLPCFPRSLTWSPDGEKIAVGGEYSESGGAIMIWNFTSGALESILEANGAAITSLHWNTNNRIASDQSNQVQIWDLMSGETLSLSVDEFHPQVIRWSPDRNRLALGTQSGVLRIWGE
ncbi:MAG: WD40 repeat domain-containing protein [bacterium]|nr:WD40 repeat domain-containing protein [bacterium]